MINEQSVNAMNKVKRNLDNQVIGLLPLILFMFLDNYFPYLLSFVIAISFCMFCCFLYWRLREKKRVSIHVSPYDLNISTLCLLFLLPATYDAVWPFAFDY